MTELGALRNAAIAELESGLRGELVRPVDAAYDRARRVWNGMIDKRPALIVRCAGVGDVIEALRFARESELAVAVRGGGHNVSGNAVCDDGLVIDLSPMKSIRVDTSARTARVEAGCTIGDVDRETQVFGLATPLGVVSQTGIAGLTLAGGIGWLRRKHGLSSDNLVSADIVTAGGELLTASETENADLFWGIRGGGGNFGIATSFEYRLHPVGPEIMTCFVAYPADRSAEVLRFCDEYTADAPNEVSPVAVLMRVPPVELFPEQWHGEPAVVVLAPYAGDVDEGQRMTRPLRELGTPIADLSGPMPYRQVQSLLDEDYPDGGHYYWKSVGLEDLGGEAIDVLIRSAEQFPSDHTTIDVWYHGGAMNDVAPGDTAFGRRPRILIGVEANSHPVPDFADGISWTRDLITDLKPFSDGGVYLNFPGFFEEGDELVRSAYGENYERLVALKDRYDPANVFRLNGNVRPSGADAA